MLKNEIALLCEEVKSLAHRNLTPEIEEKLVSFYDATTLNITDSHQSVIDFTTHVMENFPNVASICVSPRFIEDVGLTLGASSIGITATVGSFPMGQTFIEVKMLECAMAIENGADEVDFVIDVSSVNNGEWEKAQSEISELISEIDGMAVSKVILECGSLKDLETVYKASGISLDAGATFIKTSTGKTSIGTTLEHVVVMCLAIRVFHEKTGIKRGIKVAGGIRTVEDAVNYYTAVERILGEEWLTPELFRIGTSSLVSSK